MKHSRVAVSAAADQPIDRRRLQLFADKIDAVNEELAEAEEDAAGLGQQTQAALDMAHRSIEAAIKALERAARLKDDA
jgi:hypothetical protein